MDTLNEMKNNIVVSTNALMVHMRDMDSESNDAINELNKKNETLNQMNKKLIIEIAEKDHKLSDQLQTIMKHEDHVKELSQVKEEENKFGMIKAKDKEISNLVKENEHLKKELDQLKSKIDLMNSGNVECEVTDNDDNNVDDNVDDTVDKEEETEAKDTEEEQVNQSSGSESDDDVEYVIKKHKKVRYYVVKGDENSKMYEILDNDDVGDEVGELKDGKKVLY
jgi:hypothetical protein